MADVETITQHELCSIVELALANPIRTTSQQQALVSVCARMNNPFVDWTHLAADTWEGRRCQCGHAIPVFADGCHDCRPAPHRSWVVTCSDGVVRHDPFDDQAEAQRWAEWGHVCLSITHHTVDEVAA